MGVPKRVLLDFAYVSPSYAYIVQIEVPEGVLPPHGHFAPTTLSPPQQRVLAREE